MLGRLTLRNCWSWALLAVLALVCALASSGTAEAAGAITVYSVADASWLSGQYPSMVLDAAGNPVMSYHEYANDYSLRVLHCNDPDCGGGDESFVEPDVGVFGTGWWTSVQLDADGYPVVSYTSDNTTKDLHVLHCNDPDCADGDDSITAPQTEGAVGFQTALVLDDADNPVIVHWNQTDNVMDLVHCNDPLCSGDDESITTPDPSIYTWPASDRAILLDADGNPVIAYTQITAGYSTANLKILHCNDPDCSGGDESITTPDPETPNSGGINASLALDAAGNPVVAYQDILDGDLNVLHCNDADCSGGDESVASFDYASTECCISPDIELDSAGNPVVAFKALVGFYGDLRVLYCNDPNCAGGDDSIRIPNYDQVVYGIALLLDASGRPVLALDNDSGLALLHCGNVYCDFDGDGCSDRNEQQTVPATELTGGRRDPKNPHDYFNPTHDGQNRVDDVLAVVDQYFIDSGDPGYNTDTDRTLVGPNVWNLGPPNGLQRVDDILNAVHQYFHDCG